MKFSGKIFWLDINWKEKIKKQNGDLNKVKKKIRNQNQMGIFIEHF